MEELSNIKTYKEFEQQFDKEVTRQAESFVRVGYLLKVARDTNILQESGYASVAQFAKERYGLSKDVVSRYININDKFSQNGYSEYLEEKFKGFGYSKLAIMLTLPDSVVDVLTPQMSRAQITDVQKEIKEEQKITDMELLFEDKDKGQQEYINDLQVFLHKYGYDHRELFEPLANAEAAEDYIEKILNVVAPSGVETLTVRIKGRGRLMLTIAGKDKPLKLVDVRADTTQKYQWNELANEISYIYKDGTKTTWEELYGEPFEKREVNLKEDQSNGINDNSESDNTGTGKEAENQEREVQTEQENKEIEEDGGNVSGGVEEQPIVKDTIEDLKGKLFNAPVQQEEKQIPGQKHIDDVEYKEYAPEDTGYKSVAVRALPGETVFIINNTEVKEGIVTLIEIEKDLIPALTVEVVGGNTFHIGFNQKEDWGKTIFKSREAAERALAKQGGE